MPSTTSSHSAAASQSHGPGTPMQDFDTLFQAITAHATRAAEKLRQRGLVVGTLTVFFHTNRHRPDRPQYAGSRSTRLTPMSSDTFDLVGAAKRCTLAAWPKIGAASYGFTKAGVLLDDLLPYEQRPLTLFDAQREGSPALMQALDEVNGRFGKKTMVLASEGMSRSWQLRADHRSPRYTTRLTDLPVVKADAEHQALWLRVIFSRGQISVRSNVIRDNRQ